MRPASRGPVSATGAEAGGKTQRCGEGVPAAAFLHSDPQRMIYRYPRYGELYDAWQAQKILRAAAMFGPQEIRDLQMWSQLAWFDEEFQERTRRSAMDSARPRLHPRRPARGWAKSSAKSSATCCRSTASSPLPDRSRFRPRRITIPSCRCCAIPISRGCRIRACPCRRASAIRRTRGGNWRLARKYSHEPSAPPVGLWPSEGSVSDEVFDIAAEQASMGGHR